MTSQKNEARTQRALPPVAKAPPPVTRNATVKPAPAPRIKTAAIKIITIRAGQTLQETMEIGRRALLAAYRVPQAKELDSWWNKGWITEKNWPDKFLAQTLLVDCNTGDPAWSKAA